MRLVPRHRPLPSLIALAAAATLLALVLVDGSGELMAALPAVLLAFSIACKRYPGESLLLRLGRTRHRPRRRARPSPSPRISDPVRIGRLPLLAGVRPLRGPPLFSSHSI